MELPQIKEKRELLLKKIYNYCISVNWDIDKLEELAKELDLTSIRIKKLALTYARENLEPKDYNLFYKHATKTFNNSIKKYNKNLKVINPILLEKTEKTTYLLWETAEERKIVLKYIYEYCIKVNWNKFKIEELAIKLNIETTILKELALLYAKNNLTTEKFEKLKFKINEIFESEQDLKKIILPIINPILLNTTGKKTYLLWETSEEKELVSQYIYNHCNNSNWNSDEIEILAKKLKISNEEIKNLIEEYASKNLNKEELNQLKLEINKVLNNRQELKPITLAIINPILLEKTGKTTYTLWETAEEKEFVLNYIYYFCYNSNFSTTSIKELSNQLSITIYMINKCCKEYALNYLNLTEPEYKHRRIECSKTHISKQKTK